MYVGNASSLPLERSWVSRAGSSIVNTGLSMATEVDNLFTDSFDRGTAMVASGLGIRGNEGGAASSGFYQSVDRDGLGLTLLRMPVQGLVGVMETAHGLLTGNPDAVGPAAFMVGGGLASRFLGSSAVETAGKIVPNTSLAAGGAEALAVRRAYLNEKFGRTGNLNYDVTLRGYMEKIDSLDVSSMPGEAVFYSGKNPAGVSNRQLGEAFAKEKGWTTLEQTPGGKWLDQEKLYGSKKQGDFFEPADADKVWAKLSQRYASGAQQSATAFVNGAKPDRVFYMFEYPILQRNGVLIKFMD